VVGNYRSIYLPTSEKISRKRHPLTCNIHERLEVDGAIADQLFDREESGIRREMRGTCLARGPRHDVNHAWNNVVR